MKIVTVARKLSTVERRKEQNRSGKEISRTEVTDPRTVLNSRLSEGLGLVIMKVTAFVCVVQRCACG